VAIQCQRAIYARTNIYITCRTHKTKQRKGNLTLQLGRYQQAYQSATQARRNAQPSQLTAAGQMQEHQQYPSSNDGRAGRMSRSRRQRHGLSSGSDYAAASGADGSSSSNNNDAQHSGIPSSSSSLPMQSPSSSSMHVGDSIASSSSVSFGGMNGGSSHGLMNGGASHHQHQHQHQSPSAGPMHPKPISTPIPGRYSRGTSAPEPNGVMFGRRSRLLHGTTGSNASGGLGNSSGHERNVPTYGTPSETMSSSSSGRLQGPGSATRRKATSPYYGMAELDQLEDSLETPLSSISGANRSSLHHGGMISSSASVGGGSGGGGRTTTFGPTTTYRIQNNSNTISDAASVSSAMSVHSAPPSHTPSTTATKNPTTLFGTGKSKKSLEDDDPADTNPVTADHFNLRRTSNSSMSSTDWNATPLNSNQSAPPAQLQEVEQQLRRMSSPASNVVGGMNNHNNTSNNHGHNATTNPMHNSLSSLPTSATTSGGSVTSSHSLSAPNTNSLIFSSSSNNNHNTNHINNSNSNGASSNSNTSNSTTTTSANGIRSTTIRGSRIRRLADQQHTSTTSQSPSSSSPSALLTSSVRSMSDSNTHPPPSASSTTAMHHGLDRSMSETATKSRIGRTGATRPGAVQHVASAEDIISMAKENYKALLLSCNANVINISYIHELIGLCKIDQTRLQQKLSNAFEESDSIQNIEELFALNDEICSAIEVGHGVVRNNKDDQQQQTQQQAQAQQATSGGNNNSNNNNNANNITSNSATASSTSGGNTITATTATATTAPRSTLSSSVSTSSSSTRRNHPNLARNSSSGSGGKSTAPKKKKSTRNEGPTIELLVENEDVFSLICMLRAQNEKRLAAALALMQFARESESLRNEIRSSGGMHSCLTLFRTNGMTREIQVVAAMAVAYVLPSYVASSQTSPSLGLKVMECLRFLVMSNPVSPQGVAITRQEMCRASAMAVNILWIHAVQPLLSSERSSRKKAVTTTTTQQPTLRPSQSRSLRLRKAGTGSVFDQGQDSMEIQELTESSVTLITHFAKLIHHEGLMTDMGYNIVEQLCEVDVARPIVVREGLMRILVDWIRSKDPEKVRPAASALRYLISIEDLYMAGWIHSQVVNEGAVNELVKLLRESVGSDVRLAVSQMISALCVAPHTRAAVVEARCVNYLVALLFEHSSPASKQMVQFAASALVQLAAGSMTGGGMGNLESSSSNDQDHVLTEIIDGWAHGSFVQIAIEHKGKLRSIAVEALRVLSEDTNQKRQTRLQLCSAGAAAALGKTLKDDVKIISPLMSADQFGSTRDSDSSSFQDSIKELHEALCALANILEPPKPSKKTTASYNVSQAHLLNPKETLIKGCVDTAESGGLESLIWISSMPHTSGGGVVVEPDLGSVDRLDLLEESCRLLASLAPLLLSDTAAAKGCARWAIDILEAFDGILKRMIESSNNKETIMAQEATNELNMNALRGLVALAKYDPLKIRIVDMSLPKLLHAKNLGGERNDISSAASQVLLSLGFTEDEITAQVAGNNPDLLVDWFCLQRSLLIQAMARAELRVHLIHTWRAAFNETKNSSAMRLIRQVSGQSSASGGSGDEGSDTEKDLFENFTADDDTLEQRKSLVKQYADIYGIEETRRSIDRTLSDQHALLVNDEVGLMNRHVFPLNDTTSEREWVLSHRRRLEVKSNADPSAISLLDTTPQRIEKLLDCCFPSRLLRNVVVPVEDLCPQASFNFRALMMPQRRYFSFRREGQLLSRLCDKQASALDSDDVHWTLGFTNSTFAGEFVDSLVQTLYLCPMITGLSFVRNSEWLLMHDSDKENESDDQSGLMANLAGSLPPWVSYLTFDNMLSDRDLRALVVILETMVKVSSGDDFDAELDNRRPSDLSSVGQSRGKFDSFSIRNSCEITRESWNSFFKMLGQSGPSKRGVMRAPLSCLKCLDLSGNKLGDEACAFVLELVHDKDSGCNLEQLDLSGNRIGRAINVSKTLRSYTEYYRYNQTVGSASATKTWKSSLHTLILAENDLFLGQGALEILAMLKHNALCLRTLDLSNNSLEGDSYQLLASSLLKNTSLVRLNLSGNKFSAPLVDLILDHLNASDADTGLSFLRFEDNQPSLTESQRGRLSSLFCKTRKGAIERYLKDRDCLINGQTREADSNTFDRVGTELDIIDESDATLFSRSSFLGKLPSLQDPNAIEEPEPDVGDNMITVLFSAPLVFADGENCLHPFEKLDFDMERELLWQCLKEASRDIEVSFDTAHHSRLLATLTRRCSCLHYSGHGHTQFLPFEDGMGGPNWFNVDDIKELIVRDGVAPFKFVFVSACHSGLAGETFASAGVPHVVCCRQESELKDTAALAFTRQFYLALAVGHTVQESFEQGCKAVRATPNLRDPDAEMEKFVLLPKGGNHDVPVFKAKPVREWPKQPRNHHLLPSKSKRRSSLVRMRSVMGLGAKSSELSVRNMMQEDPSPTPPQFFLGREVDMFYVLTAILKLRKRLVSILGEVGIGRSSLACALCHYINERASTMSEIHRIYFVKPRQGGRNITCRLLVRQLLDQLEDVGKAQPIDEDADTESMLNVICKSLKNDKALVVFDRTEQVKKTDEGQEFPMILSTLLYETKQVKIILTGEHPLGIPSIGGQVEHPFNLGALNFSNTVKLFTNLCPHLHTPSDRRSLARQLISCEEQKGESEALNERMKRIFDMLGNGVPSKIEKAAYSIKREDLEELKTELSSS